MFIDYYALLEIDVSSTEVQIKAAFKKQAFKWHPDRNIDQDTTLRMQQINEAYLILKDNEARKRYDKEYYRYKQYQQQKEYSEKQYKQQESDTANNNENKKENERDFSDNEYSIYDDILSKWMHNARQQAVNLAKQTIEDFKGASTDGAKAFGSAVIAGVVRLIGFSILMLIIFSIARGCK